MNVNFLITGNNFTAATGLSSAFSKPDAGNKSTKFSLTPVNKHSQVNKIEKPTADNVNKKEIQNQKGPDNKSSHKRTRPIHNKTKSEKSLKDENKTKTEKQNENPIAMEHSNSEVENINLTTDQAETSQVQHQPAAIDPEKSVPASQQDAKASTSQNISNTSNPNNKEAVNTNTDIRENQSTEKPNITAAYALTIQTKDQSNSTLEEQSGQGTLSNQSMQSDGAQQQYSANPKMQENHQNFNENYDYFIGDNSYESLSELQEALISDGSINLLI